MDELSRLGRNTIDFLTTLHWLEEKEVNVVVRNMGNFQSIVKSKKNHIWNLITSVMCSLYEVGRNQIFERTEMGRKVGSNENIKTYLNIPKSKQFRSLLDKGKSVRDICARLIVSSKRIVKVKSSEYQTANNLDASSRCLYSLFEVRDSFVIFLILV